VAEDGTNSDLWVYAKFDERLREHVRHLVTPELVAEYERDPRLPSDDLTRVMEYFGRVPLAGKHVVVSVEPFSDYRIGILAGAAGTGVEIGDESFESSQAAKRAIFMQRLRDLGVDWL
jgi:hypothetical protein